MRAVSATERYPAWIWAPQSERKPLVTLRSTTEGRISLLEMLLVAAILTLSAIVPLGFYYVARLLSQNIQVLARASAQGSTSSLHSPTSSSE